MDETTKKPKSGNRLDGLVSRELAQPLMDFGECISIQIALACARKRNAK